MTPGSSAPLSLYSVGRSAFTLAGGAVAVQVLGIVRELFLATQIGATAQLDALLIALVMPIAVPSVLTSGAVAALVPAYLEVRHREGLSEARQLAGTIVAWVAIVGGLIWLSLELLAGAVVAVTGPGLSEGGQVAAVGYLHLLAPIAFITAVSAILFAVCQAEERFVAIAVASLAGQATTLAIMLIFWDPFGLDALAIGSLVGPIVVVLLILGAMMRASIVPVPVLRSHGLMGPFIRHAAPLTVGAAILQLNLIADRAVASLLGPGSVSILRYADVLVRVPVGAIGPAWGSAIYPALVRSTLDGVVDSLASDAGRSLRYACALFVPIAMLTAAVAPVAVDLAYGRGAFTAEDLTQTALAVAAFAPLLLILMTSPILTGAHNARRRGRVLLTGAIFNVTMNIGLDVFLGISLGVTGVALASSISSTLVLLYFTRRMIASETAFDVRPVARTLGLAALASAPVTIAAALLCWTGLGPSEPLPAFILLVAIGILGPLGYLVSARALGMQEPRALVATVLDVLPRRGRA